MNEKAILAQLKSEIARLEEEQQFLKAELYKATEQEIYKTAMSYSYKVKQFFYRAIPLSMITTPFYYKRESIAKKATACFMSKLLEKIKVQADFALDFTPQLHFAMLCEQVISCGNSIMFILSDPYRTIQTAPIDTMSFQEAETYVGKIVIAKLILSENYKSEKYFTLKAIKSTSFASDYRMEHEDWHILRQYLNASGDTECMQALKNIERELTSKYPFVSPENMKSYSAWINEKEFRISTDKRLMCFCIINGTIWYADELRVPQDELGPYSIAREYNSYSVLSGILECESNKYIPLLMTGEENFEIFEP